MMLDHSSQTDATPLSAEELSIQCLGARSGTLKGLGMRPSSSLRSTATSDQDIERVKQLEERILQLEAANKAYVEKAAVDERRDKKMEKMFTWLQSLGYNDPDSPDSLAEDSW